METCPWRCFQASSSFGSTFSCCWYGSSVGIVDSSCNCGCNGWDFVCRVCQTSTLAILLHFSNLMIIYWFNYVYLKDYFASSFMMRSKVQPASVDFWYYFFVLCYCFSLFHTHTLYLCYLMSSLGQRAIVQFFILSSRLYFFALDHLFNVEKTEICSTNLSCSELVANLLCVEQKFICMDFTCSRRGAIVTTFIVCYAFTSIISGYVSGGMYSRMGGTQSYIIFYMFFAIVIKILKSQSWTGKKWIKSMILTASLFPFLCFGIGFVLNTVAIFYGSLAAIPFGTMVVVFVIWSFISFPLALLGTVFGRNWSGTPNNPCRVKTIPRPIPEKKWYLTPSVVSIMGGLLPFGSIFIEMYFVFTSFWNYKVKLLNIFNTYVFFQK